MTPWQEAHGVCFGAKHFLYNAAALPSPTVGTFAKERKRGRSNWWVSLWFPEDPKTFCSPSRPRDPKSFLLPGPIGPGKSTSGWLPGSHPPTKRGYELLNFAKRPSPWTTGDINEGQSCQASMYRTKNALPKDHGKAPKNTCLLFLVEPTSRWVCGHSSLTVTRQHANKAASILGTQNLQAPG